MIEIFSIGICLLIFSIIRIYIATPSNNIQLRMIDNYTYALLVVFLIILGGIRGPETGIDDGQYLEFFSSFDAHVKVDGFLNSLKEFRYEPTMYVIAAFSMLISNSSYVFLFIYCALAVTLNAVAYKKYSPFPLVSMVVYFSHLYINKELNQIRFGLASALFVFFIILYSSRYYLYSLIFFALAVSTHYSTAIGLLLLPILLFLRERQYLPFALILFSIPIGLVGGKTLLSLLHLNVPIITDKLGLYEGSKFDYSYGVLSLGNIKNILYCFVFCYFLLGKENKNNKVIYALVICYAVGGGFRIAFSDFGDVGTRVGNLFLHVEPILIAWMFSLVRNKFISIGFFLFTVLYYLNYNLIIDGEHAILGYTVSPPFTIF